MAFKDQSKVNVVLTGTERGSIFFFFAIFLVALMPLLALGIDGFYAMQSQLDEENIAEYVSFAGISGFTNTTGDYLTKRNGALQSAQTHILNNATKVKGVSNDASWDFTGSSCSGTTCTGDGWTMEFGRYNLDADNINEVFMPAFQSDVGNPDSIDPNEVSAVKVALSLPSGTDFVDFFKGAFEASAGDTVSSSQTVSSGIAYTITVNPVGGDPDDPLDDIRTFRVVSSKYEPHVPPDTSMPSYCGDSSCDSDESSDSCLQDCPATCGDGVCSGAAGEQYGVCSDDCGSCGDGICDPAFEDAGSCSDDCQDSCGDSVCDGSEDYNNCSQDCENPGFCGDGNCDGGEDESSCDSDCQT